jgi:hypothetical protein
MSNTVQNGKGDKARNNYSEQFRQNYDLIFGTKRAAGASNTAHLKRLGSGDTHCPSDQNGTASIPTESFSE